MSKNFQTSRGRYKKLLWLLVIPLLLAPVYAVLSGSFKVKDISVKLTDVGCASEQEIKSFIGTGQLVIAVNETGLAREIQNKFGCLSGVKVDKSYSGKLSVEAVGRTAVIQIAPMKYQTPFDLKELMEASPSSSAATILDWSMPNTAGDQWYWVDEEGVVFGKGYNENLDRIFMEEQEIKVGNQLDDRFAKILTITRRVKTLDEVRFATVASGTAGKNDEKNVSTPPILQGKVFYDYLLIPSSPKLAFSLKTDVLKQIASLQLILQKAKIDSKIMDTIDLRFDKPIVVYDPLKNKR